MAAAGPRRRFGRGGARARNRRLWGSGADGEEKAKDGRGRRKRGRSLKEMSGRRGHKPDSVSAREGRLGSFVFAANPERRPLAGTRAGRAKRSLFGLAPGGACLDRVPSPGRAVVSCTAFSPLPGRTNRPGGCFLWRFPSARISRAPPSLAAGTPCPVESGLSSARCGAAIRRPPARQKII